MTTFTYLPVTMARRLVKLIVVTLVAIVLSTTWLATDVVYKETDLASSMKRIYRITSSYFSRPTFNASDIYSRVALPANTCDVTQLKPWGRRVVTEVHPPVARDCQLLRKGDENETNRVENNLKSWQNSESFTQWSLRMSNCSNVLEELSNNFYISEEELNFPLAFSFIIYSDAMQVFRLLKALYRPHNIYCIHPDAKQLSDFTNVFISISKCLGNVFIASKLEKVYYHDGSSIIRAQLNCLGDLLQLSTKRWRYVINMCGTELPLKTNRQIVRTLKKMKGVSAVTTAEISNTTWLKRFTYKRILNDKRSGKMARSNEKLGPPPHNITLYKSLTYIAASYPFANFTLNSKIAVDLREFLTRVKAAEEHFYASLYHYPNAPGGYNKSVELPIVEHVMWLYDQDYSLCHGEVIRGVCVLSVGDLPEIYRLAVEPTSTMNFFFNKYFMEKDHVVMDCLEEELLKQNRVEYNSDCSHG